MFVFTVSCVDDPATLINGQVRVCGL